MPLNISSVKEFIILIAGPSFQIIASFILIEFFLLDKNIVLTYHYSILLFNLLPIYPLDGGKLINLFLNIYFPYKLSLKISIYFSYITLLIIVFVKKSITINIIVLISLSFILITKEKRRINHLYNKFILERYLNNFHFKKSKLINNPSKFYRNHRHIIKEEDNYYLEKEFLLKKFQKKAKNR